MAPAIERSSCCHSWACRIGPAIAPSSCRAVSSSVSPSPFALANAPPVILADEPTGELDSRTSAEIFALLRKVNEELGTTIVSVTHDPLVAEHVGRTVAIRDGRTSTETVRRTEFSDEGDHQVISEEFAMLDRAGRLQLPRAHLEHLALSRRVRVLLEDDHVEIWPDRAPQVEPGRQERS